MAKERLIGIENTEQWYLVFYQYIEKDPDGGSEQDCHAKEIAPPTLWKSEAARREGDHDCQNGEIYYYVSQCVRDDISGIRPNPQLRGASIEEK